MARNEDTLNYTLRPLERRMVQLAESGMDEVEIAWRFRRNPRYVRQVLELAERPGRDAYGPSTQGSSTNASSTDNAGLRPIERRVLKWREQGAGIDELAPLFRRTERYLQQVENLARYKLAQS